MQLLDPITPPRQAAIGVDISDELEKVIMKALAKERDLRYRTMAELLVGLEGAAGGIPLETSIPITGQVPVVGRATSSPPIMSAISGVSPPIRARSTSSPPGMVGPPSVIFAERQSQPEIVPPSRTAERSAHMARHRSRTLMLGAMVMVGVAGAVVGIALYFGGAGDDEEAFGADAGSRAVLGQVDAAAAAGPLDGAAASTAPDAALRRAPPDARPLQVIKPPPDAALRVVSPPPPRRTINVMVLTEPPEGVIFQGDRQLPDRSMVRGLEGTQTEVRCEMFKRERTTITIRFDRDKTVFCKMPELKDPFEKVKEPEGPKEPLKE
jgi:hypothetical protein